MQNISNKLEEGCGDCRAKDNEDKSFEKRQEDFKFSYISSNEFNAIFKQVKRERQRKQEAREWQKFLSMKEQEKAQVKCSDSNINSSVPDSPRIEVAPLTEPETKEKPTTYKLPACIPTDKQIPPQNNCYPQQTDNEMNLSETVDGQSPRKDENGAKQEYAESNLENKTKSSPLQKEREDKLLVNFERKTLMKKLEDLRGKIVLTLNGIEQALSDQPFDISQEEVEILRTRKRNSAFTSRFKRNYHYQLICQINEVKKIFGNEALLKSKPLITAHKFVSSHQSVLQALQALEKHLLASCTNDDTFIWLKEFIESVSELSSLLPSCEGINFNINDNRNNVKLACEQLNEKIECINEINAGENRAHKKRAPKKLKSGNTPQDNLWMYRTHRLTWKEKAADMAKIQMARRRRKKGANKDEIGTEKKVHPSELKLLKMEVKQREGAELRRHSRTVREEQVRTMMEIIPEESESENEGEEKKIQPKSESTSEEITVKPNNEPVKAKLQELIDCRNAVMLAANTQQRRQIEQTETKSDDPSNVKVVYIKCENETPYEKESSNLFKRVKKNMVRDYKKAFKSFKAQSVWYDDNVNNLVKGITTRLTDEFLQDVVKEINVDHIIKKIIDMELKEV